MGATKYTKYCTGCGLCISFEKAKMTYDKKGFMSINDGNEKWLEKICPFLHSQMKLRDVNNIWGKNKSVYLGWSNDTKVRNKASSGGILTELASFLVESKMVDYIIHICADEINPTKNTICISKNRDELIRRSGSRYSISHPLLEMNTIDLKKKYAFIGKPCDVIALKNLMEIEPKYKEAIPYTLSFFCMGMPSNDAQISLLDRMGCPIDECVKLQYRGNGWPGYAIATDKEGHMYKLDYDSSWGEILGRDLLPACRFCLDGIGELADISCGDAWYLSENNSPDFSEHEGRNVIFARTEKGKKIIEEVQRKGYISVDSFDSYHRDLKMMQASQYDRRTTMIARVFAMFILRRPSPSYPLKILCHYAKDTSIIRLLIVFCGTCKRVFRGKI